MSYQYRQFLIKTTGLLMVLAGLFALGFAWIAENEWDMAPCGLCLLERWPYRVLIVAGLGLLIFRGRLVSWIKAIITLTLLVSIGLSFLHVGVEQGWWNSPLPECYSVASQTHDLAARFAEMPDRPHKPCDLPSYLFSWLPISLTLMNGLYSLVLFVWLIMCGRVERRHNSKFH